jgi:precorrin-6x reductase
MAMDDARERLRDLSAGLVRLHALLLERERHAYEERHGPVGSWELLQLLLRDEQFAWLRSLSSLMAQIDALVDADEPVAAANAQGLMRDAYRLLSSGESGAFQDKYRAALQESADVVMVHAGIAGTLRRHGVGFIANE